MFTYNNVYYFRYAPATIEKIHIYDQYPLVIFLEIKGQVALGVNTHWIPGPLRAKFIQVILEMRNKCITESLFHLWYRTIKYTPQLSFALGAIRKYYLSHCSNIKIIPQEQWDTLTLSHSLYKGRYLQRSNYNPQRHIIRGSW
jgi:hypothetical protein